MPNAFKYSLEKTQTMEQIQLQDPTPIWPMPKNGGPRQRLIRACIDIITDCDKSKRIDSQGFYKQSYWGQFFTSGNILLDESSSTLSAVVGFRSVNPAKFHYAFQISLKTRTYTEEEEAELLYDIQASLNAFIKQLRKDVDPAALPYVAAFVWNGSRADWL